MNWFLENLPTLVVSLVLAGAVALVILSMVRRRKQGKTACGCSCGGCPMNGSCHSKKPQ